MFKIKKKPKKISYGTKNIFKVYETWKYCLREKEKNKGAYPYFGLKCYYGGQGKGKTLSAVREVIWKCEKYKNLVLITNVEIKGIKNKTEFFKTPEELFELLEKYVDGEPHGVIVLADEIQVIFSEMFRERIQHRLIAMACTNEKIISRNNRNYTAV